MPTMLEIMQANDMPPVGDIGHNLTIWTQGRWQHYAIDWFEQMTRGEAFMRDFGALAANTLGTATLVTQLQLDEDVLLQVRFEPVDDIEVIVWETRSVSRFTSKNIVANVSRFTALTDPHWKQTTLFVLGKERDLYMQLRNVTDYALTMSRVKFWGYRFNLRKLQAQPSPTTYITAEGRV